MAATEHGRITDEALATLERRTGVEHEIAEPFLRYVNADSIRHVARAIGDKNPLWIDEEHGAGSRFGSIVAPPAFLYGVSWGSWDLRRGEGLPGVHGLHSRDRWTYYLPMLPGDEITAFKKQISLEPKEGSFAGRAIIQTREVNFFNQRGERVARCQMSAFRVERSSGKQKGKYADVAAATYSEEELEKIDAAVEAELVRGGETRYFEDVEVGEKLQPIVRGPLTVADMICWMMGVGSPHVRSGQYWLEYRRRSPAVAVRNPKSNVFESVERVHWDAGLAAEIGVPAPYDYGSQRGGWATHLITNWAGDDAWVGEVDVKYRGMNFLGDTVWIDGEVTDKWTGKSGIGYVETSIHGVNQRGDDIMPGRAVVALPTREAALPQSAIDHEEDRG